MEKVSRQNDLESGLQSISELRVMTLPLKPAVLRRLNTLISYGRMIAPATGGSDFELEDAESAIEFKQDVTDLFLDLGLKFSDLREELGRIPAVKPGTTWHFDEEGEPLGKSKIDVVDVRQVRRMVRYLIKARRRLPRSKVAEKGSSAERTARGPYSPTDDKIFKLVGKEAFRALTNKELFQRYRKDANKAIERKVEPEMFRNICKRIRNHHGLPPSATVRKRIKLPKA